MLGFDNHLGVQFEGAFVNKSPLSWIANNSRFRLHITLYLQLFSKPGRPSETECWVLHASPEWSSANLDSSNDEVTKRLKEAFSTAIKQSIPTPTIEASHKWVYASVPSALKGNPFHVAN
jgi:predicted NAD/FAD-dependent oxidoreductase